MELLSIRDRLTAEALIVENKKTPEQIRSLIYIVKNILNT